jgi:hypothetical protein
MLIRAHRTVAHLLVEHEVEDARANCTELAHEDVCGHRVQLGFFRKRRAFKEDFHSFFE